jgi:vacuolar iron transporter family protein
LAALYRRRGLSPATAATVAAELTDHNALAAHAEVELHLDPDELTKPWQAAAASAIAFTAGALLPLVAVLLPSRSWRVPVTFVAVLIALAVTGWVSASLGSARPRQAILRVTLGGAVAMAVTYGIGAAVGAVV